MAKSTWSAATRPGRDMSMMPRFGTELVVAPGFENFTWYGRGPKETMIDRAFERIGVYKSTVDAEWVEYMRPQENGNKVDVRWMRLTNAAGVGIEASGAAPLNVTARHYTKTDMERAGYTFQMKRHPEIYLNLDDSQMGAGGIDSWSLERLPDDALSDSLGRREEVRATPCARSVPQTPGRIRARLP